MVIAEARRLFAADTAPPAIRKAVLGVVAANADAATWDRLHALATAEKVPLVRQQYYDQLAAANDPALARRALALALTDDPGATTGAGMIGGVAQNHPDLALDFALANMAAVDKIVDETSRSRYYARLAGGSADLAIATKIEAYADKHLTRETRRDADTAAANIRYRVRIVKERLPAIHAWLANHAG